MFLILGWLIYGLLVGSLAKKIHPPEDKINWISTAFIGVVGSFIGGFLNWVLGSGGSPFSPSGIVMGLVGGVLFCWIYRKYRLNRFFKMQGRMPGNIIHKKDE